MLAEHNAPPYRDRIIEWLADRFPRSTTWPVPSELSAGDFTERLVNSARSRRRSRVVGLEDWSPEAESRLFSGLNYRREDLPEGATRFAQKAPDLWAWRTAVLDLAFSTTRAYGHTHEPTLAFLGEDAEQLRVCRREIEEHLKAKGEPTHADGALLLETARIHERLGEWDQALQAAEQARAIYWDNDDQRGLIC